MKFTSTYYNCPSCGAAQSFSPKLGKLECDFCKTQTDINSSTDTNKHPFSLDIKSSPNKIDTKEISCKKCGASFENSPYMIASICPYCKTPTLTPGINPIPIDGIIPFAITHKEAQKLFKKWVGSLWFAPTKFTKYLDGDNKLTGEYIPHWSFDTDTTTSYSGARGDAYYVTVDKTITDQNGNRRVVQVQERRIRWTPVSGVVHNSFHDITACASSFVDKPIVEDISPWESNGIKAFDDRYLSGFLAQEYTSSLQQGFKDIKQKIAPYIRRKILADIGGDEQQIHSIKTHYQDTKFQNNLYPIWSASFVWNDKEYDYAINAQTGQVSGERPYSIIKIVFAILTIMIIAGLVYIATDPQAQEYIKSLLGY